MKQFKVQVVNVFDDPVSSGATWQEEATERASCVFLRVENWATLFDA